MATVKAALLASALLGVATAQQQVGEVLSGQTYSMSYTMSYASEVADSEADLQGHAAQALAAEFKHEAVREEQVSRRRSLQDARPGQRRVYMGCFADPNDSRDMQNGTDAFLNFHTAEQVADECATLCNGFRYMGLQWRAECWCANYYGSQGPSVACGENEGELCGNGEEDCFLANAVWDLTPRVATPERPACTLPARSYPFSGVNSIGYRCEVPGCINPAALNYSPVATVDDGSCVADLAVAPQTLMLTGRLRTPNEEYYFRLQPDLMNNRPHYATADGSMYLYWSAPSLTLRNDAGRWYLDNNDDDSDHTTWYTAYLVSTSLALPLGATTWIEYYGDVYNGGYQDNPSFALTEGRDTVWGCMDPAALNYSPVATMDDGTCRVPYVAGECPSGTAVLTASAAERRQLDFTSGHADSASCAWDIHCEQSDMAPMLRFTALDTEQDYNFVSVHAGDSVEATRVAHLSGSAAPAGAYSARAGELLVVFTSDGSVTAEGFAAEYWCVMADSVGCTDAAALNYSPVATVDDGSCVADLAVAPQTLMLTGLIYTDQGYDVHHLTLQPDLMNNRPHYSMLQDEGTYSSPSGPYLYWSGAAGEGRWTFGNHHNDPSSSWAYVRSTSLTVPLGSSTNWFELSGRVICVNPYTGGVLFGCLPCSYPVQQPCQRFASWHSNPSLTLADVSAASPQTHAVAQNPDCGARFGPDGVTPWRGCYEWSANRLTEHVATTVDECRKYCNANLECVQFFWGTSTSCQLARGGCSFADWNGDPTTRLYWRAECIDAPADCAGTWSACTVDCEAAADRTWTEETASVGTGTACPDAANCAPGDDACPAATAPVAAPGSWFLASTSIESMRACDCRGIHSHLTCRMCRDIHTGAVRDSHQCNQILRPGDGVCNHDSDCGYSSSWFHRVGCGDFDDCDMSSPSSQCAEEDWGSGMEAYFSDACCYEEVSIMGVLVAMALVLSACVFYRFRYHKDEECCRGMRNAWNATAWEAQQDSSAALTHESMITNPMALSGMLQVQATILDNDEEDGDGSTPTISVEIPEMLPAETRRRGQQATSGAPESDLSLSKGDRVTWTKSDDDVPIGSVGEVKGPAHGGRLSVEFSGTRFNFRPEELTLATSPHYGPLRRPTTSSTFEVEPPGRGGTAAMSEKETRLVAEQVSVSHGHGGDRARDQAQQQRLVAIVAGEPGAVDAAIAAGDAIYRVQASRPGGKVGLRNSPDMSDRCGRGIGVDDDSFHLAIEQTETWIKIAENRWLPKSFLTELLLPAEDQAQLAELAEPDECAPSPVGGGVGVTAS
jgi:hypothetical protein